MMIFSDHSNGLIRPHATGEAVNPSNQAEQLRWTKGATQFKQAAGIPVVIQHEEPRSMGMKGYGRLPSIRIGAVELRFERRAER